MADLGLGSFNGRGRRKRVDRALKQSWPAPELRAQLRPPPRPLTGRREWRLTFLGVFQLVLGPFLCLEELVDALGLAGHDARSLQVQQLLQNPGRDRSVYP